MRTHGQGRRNRNVRRRIVSGGAAIGTTRDDQREGARAGRAGGRSGPPKAGAGGDEAHCPRAAARALARSMPGPGLGPAAGLAPLPLTAVYAPRQPRRHRKRRALQHNVMLDSDLPIKPSLSPFRPLPAIGQKFSSETKVILFDLDKEMRPATVEERPALRMREALQPLSSLEGLGPVRHRTALEPLGAGRKPQQLLRENTYDVIEPIFLTPSKVKSRDTSVSRLSVPSKTNNSENISTHNRPKISARSRFKKAALEVAKLSAMPETGKLLCLRERETLQPVVAQQQQCHLLHLPPTPTRDLDRLSEIFQSLELKGRSRDKAKRENSWF
ncbi:hypothetical protein EVAR_99007_1 [Eumeta japonica]|uniref:Uncharacterized protein n=1 Tax=Eumeta variegata TaxID=151549 RepID=A0A4C1Y2F3_EUMVA|nr:hypothetical protein EVAR_99007_1 [Eumeta japonica]